MRPFKKLLRIYNGFILPLILLAVSAGITFWGIIPGVKTIQNTFLDNEKLSKEVSSIKKRVNVLESIDLTTLESYLQSLISAVPQDKSYPSFLLGLEGVALQTNIALNEFKVDNPGSLASEAAELRSATANQNIVTSDINIAGNLDQMKAFFDTIIRVRRLMAVTSFSLSFPKDSETMVSTVSVRAFYAPLPRTLGKAIDDLEPFSDKDSELLARISAYPSALVTGSLPLEGSSGQIREDPFSL